MNRFYRLMAPAVTFSALGTALLFVAPLPAFRLYGGLATAGAYALLIQVVVTLLLVVSIDDLRGQRRVWSGALLEAADPAYGLRRALTHFYLRRFTPAALLAFGLAESTTTLAIGALDGPSASGVYVQPIGAEAQRSALLVAFLLVAVGLVVFRHSLLACYGWCIGFVGGAVAAEVALTSQPRTSITLLLWSAALLCVGRSAALLVRRAADRRRAAPSTQRAEASEHADTAVP